VHSWQLFFYRVPRNEYRAPVFLTTHHSLLISFLFRQTNLPPLIPSLSGQAKIIHLNSKSLRPLVPLSQSPTVFILLNPQSAIRNPIPLSPPLKVSQSQYQLCTLNSVLRTPCPSSPKPHPSTGTPPTHPWLRPQFFHRIPWPDSISAPTIPFFRTFFP